MSYDAFVSYAKHDRAFVSGLCGALASGGVTLWVDTQYLEPPWRDSVTKGIRSSRAVLFVHSRNWISSRACTYELEAALEQDKPLVVVALDATPLPHALGERSVAVVDGAAGPESAAEQLRPSLVRTAAG
jgi:hypothetical protein